MIDMAQSSTRNVRYAMKTVAGILAISGLVAFAFGLGVSFGIRHTNLETQCVTGRFVVDTLDGMWVSDVQRLCGVMLEWAPLATVER